MRERPRQRRQSLSRPATTQFIPHVPQDSPRSDLRNVFYSPPASSRRHRARPNRCGGCTALPNISNGHRLRLSLCGCMVARHARRLVLPLSFRTVSRRTTGTMSSFPDPITAAGHHHTRLPRHLPAPHRIRHRAHKKETEKPKLLRPQIVCVMQHALPVGMPPPQGYFHTGLTAGLRTNCSTTATDPCDPDGSRVHTTSP